LLVLNTKQETLPYDGVGLQETALHSEHWSTELQDRISRQRTVGRHLCDVIVGCDDGDDAFPAHRCVLSASSDYFCALFSSRLGDFVVRDGVWHVSINTSLLGVSRHVIDTVSIIIHRQPITT